MTNSPSDPKPGGVLYVLPKAPEGADDALREALEARKVATLTGTCPACGATVKNMGRDHREVSHGVLQHESECVAHDDSVGPMLQDHASRGFKFEDERIYVEPPEE